MEEIDLFLASDDSMPPGIENDDYDSEGDIRFLEELLSNDPLPLPENESSNLYHFNDPSPPRPPPEPPDVEMVGFHVWSLWEGSPWAVITEYSQVVGGGFPCMA
ncbi:hypothetical protein Tco_0051442 [Tanacetum coccineum]